MPHSAPSWILFEHLTRCIKWECAVSPNLILKHLISSVVILAQLVSSSVALPAKLVFPIVSWKVFCFYSCQHWGTTAIYMVGNKSDRRTATVSNFIRTFFVDQNCQHWPFAQTTNIGSPKATFQSWFTRWLGLQT